MLLTRSRAVDRLRTLSRRRQYEYSALAEQAELTSSEPLPDEASMLSQQQSAMRQALYTLPPEQRKALELAFFSELTHVEIAAALGIPLGTIKARVRMAMDKLRVALHPPTTNARSAK